jgi:hypothetical protein
MFRYRPNDAKRSRAGEAHCALTGQLNEDADGLREAQAAFERALEDGGFPAALHAARRVIDAADSLQRMCRIAAASSSPRRRQRKRWRTRSRSRAAATCDHQRNAPDRSSCPR